MLYLIKKIFRYLKGYKFFLQDFFAFRFTKNQRFSIKWSDRMPCLYEKTPNTWFDGHYVYHPAWALRIVKKINPIFHIDISSTLHFCANLSAFVPVEFYDYRPADLALDNLKSKKGDLTNLPFPTNSVQSISCMHTIEHVGLGRYGDPLDPNGDLKAIDELKRVTAINGSLIFVTPTGKPKIQFNAHRIYSYEQILSYFEGFELQETALVTDDGQFLINPSIDIFDNQNYGCGCFWFIKK
jgi:SAM-dependent methyltransferase